MTFLRRRAPKLPTCLEPEAIPFVEVVIVPVSPDAPLTPVVDVTIVPAMFAEPLPRYKVEARGFIWTVVDTTNPRYRLPPFHDESCAVACCDALNLTGVEVTVRIRTLPLSRDRSDTLR